ncbi:MULTISPECIES: DUF7848 domain-containing protein [Streptomycetaceae]|uniref:DUF7848 domain-containing protein n=1 Tax=Streptantibioticus cattleyicolor (strain ATCC 35852 / DSM 46488 / JCM 4925 / NBRC 14057 / NRRL 8057) TaxID=1003195 RepID=F8JPQ7_STREN|nr:MULTISPECIES: hypothetical protein [Streptomycetaceae]AEW92749.1 hypothetical protein SCATT_03780 [Streptantibioticus cattleyicolor NRRL 8057 = DSM 46488]MYS57513.1 hypothetical protein [Streptomyces sp. SID5468]CCB73103.1 putative Gp25.3 [Streptantibioticus cattleyicolor NRRL 8057 = DSM 46488]
MGTTKTFRFRNYDIHPDTTAETTYAAECVTGEEADCGAQSGEEVEAAKVDRWIAEHVRNTGHQRFRRTVASFVTAEPGAWQ